MSRFLDSDPFASYRDRFRTIVVFAGQDAVAGENVEFLVEAARKNPETLFIYVPRTDNPGFPPDKANLLYRPGINIYEYLMWCDIHCHHALRPPITGDLRYSTISTTIP